MKLTKNCYCPGYICVTVYRSSIKQSLKDRQKNIEFTARMKINLNHNHELTSREALKKRSLDPSIKEKIVSMFKYGHGASTCVNLYLLDLLMMNEEQYFNLIHDGKYLPTKSQVQHYLNPFKKELVAEPLDLNHMIEDYLLASPGARVKHFCIDNKDNQVITIITPLMLKVHRHIPRSGQVISVSLSEKINRQGVCIATLSTHWDLGPLPLGIIILQQNDKPENKKPINILKEALFDFVQSTQFGGFFYGEPWPQVIITDKDLVPIVASVWANSLVLPSQSSVLKSVWNWLQDPANNIAFSEREGFYYTFKKILYSSSANERNQHFSELSIFCADVCPSYLKFVESLLLCEHLLLDYQRKEKLQKTNVFSHIELEPCSSVEILSNYVYNQMLVWIQKIFLSLTEVVDFLVNHLESYYYVRIMKMLKDYYPRSVLSKYLEMEEDPEELGLQPSDFDKDCYFVVKQDIYHYVDYKHKLCSNSVKSSRLESPCSHINAVLNYVLESRVEKFEVTEEVKEVCRILLGDQYMSLQLEENSVIVINTDTGQSSCESVCAMPLHHEQTYVDQLDEDGNQWAHDPNAKYTEELDQKYIVDTTQLGDVEYVTVGASDLSEIEPDLTKIGQAVLDFQTDLEESSKFIRNAQGENAQSKEKKRTSTGEQKPTDQMRLKSLKRKRETFDVDATDVNTSAAQLPGAANVNTSAAQLPRATDVNTSAAPGAANVNTSAAQSPGANNKLVSLRSILNQYPGIVSKHRIGDVVVKKMINEINSETKLEKIEVSKHRVGDVIVKKIMNDKDSEAKSDRTNAVSAKDPQNEHTINQETGSEADNEIITLGRILTKKDTSMFSLSDNVIIIDPKISYANEKKENTREGDYENDLRKFTQICEWIKQHPSQYKTVMRNMIDVYETFYGDSSYS